MYICTTNGAYDMTNENKLFTSPEWDGAETYAVIAEANADDAYVIEWMEHANIGDVFPNGATMQRVA
jgi:hypothetical protein